MTTNAPARETPTLPSGARMTVVAGIEPARKPRDLGRDLALFANNAKLRQPERKEAQRLAVAVDAELIRLENSNAALQAQNEALREDAENWRALLACRMRTLGGAKVNEPDEPWTYLTMEFWTGHPDPTDQPWIHEHFAKFIAKARRAALSRSKEQK